MFTANEALTNLPDPRYIDPVKRAPFQPGTTVGRRRLQGWTDADFEVGKKIKGGAYDGWTVCEVMVPGGKFPGVEGGLRPAFVSGGVAGDVTRSIIGHFENTGAKSEVKGLPLGPFLLAVVIKDGRVSLRMQEE